MKFILSTIFIYVLPLLFSTSILKANNDSTQTLPAIVLNDLVDVTEDLGFVGSEIITISKYNWLHIGSALGGVLLSSVADESLRSETQTMKRTETTNTLAKFANEYGNLYVPTVLTGGIYLTGLIIQDDEVKTTGRLLGEALLVAGVINTSLKYIVGRSRPYMNEGNGTLRPFSWGEGSWSFPSGHTNVAFTVGGILSNRINRWWATAGLYSIAALTGVTRMYYDKHWLSDVIMGGIVGTFASHIVLEAEQARKSTEKANTMSRWFISPTIQGLAVTYTF